MSGVLVIQTAFLGDVVLTTPLIAAAAERFHPLPVSALVIPPGAMALGWPADPVPGLDEIIVYDKRGRDRGFMNFLKFAKRIREHRFDLALVPHRSHRSAALAWLAKIPLRVGFSENALGFLYTHKVPRRMDVHEVLRNMALLDPFGGPPAGFVPRLKVSTSDNARASAGGLLKDAPKGKMRVGIAPGSVWGTKQWMPEGFAAVMDGLYEKHRASFVIIGGPGDVDAAEKVVRSSRAPALNLAGKTSIPEMIAAIETLDLFITNDTGPMHIAAALGVPVFALFGPTSPARTGPYGRIHRIIRTDIPCAPCYRRHCKEPKCMQGIAVETVLRAINEWRSR